MTSKRYNEIETIKEPAINTGNELLDSFWSRDGGIIIGSSIFLTGTPGAGKTTFAVYLQSMLGKYKTLLYSREMPSTAVKDQTKGIIKNSDNTFICDSASCPNFNSFLKELDEVKPEIFIIDSLQIISNEDFPDMTKENAEIYIIKILRKWAIDNNSVFIMIGHVNKNGVFNGVNTVMHLFDAHLEMIYYKKENIRTIAWGQKNRKGPLKKLYYDIDNSGINFYTEEKIELKNTETNFIDYINECTCKYINLSKDKEIKKEISERITLMPEDISDIEFVNNFILITNDILNKYRM